MSVTVAIILLGGAIALLIMALIVVRIARGLDGSMPARNARGKVDVLGVSNALASLRAVRRGDKGATVALKELAASGAGGSVKRGVQAIALAASVIAIVSGLATALLKDNSPPVSSEITAGALHGTLLGARRPKHVVLIVPGSGPTDRDGNSPRGVRANSYKLLAEDLSAKDIASVRIDKRGMFASAGAGDGNKVSIQVYSDDIHAWIDAIKAETRVKCVWLLGHSEGALMVSAAAAGRRDVCGVILVAGTGRKLGDVLREQLRANPANAPLLDQALGAISELEAGRHVDAEKLHPALLPLFAPQVQDFLISMMSVDPVEVLRAARKKALILQGTNDIQVSAEDANRLNAAPRTTLRMIQGMNHVLKLAPADRAGNIATYSDPALPLAPGLVRRIASFMKDDD